MKKRRGGPRWAVAGGVVAATVALLACGGAPTSTPTTPTATNGQPVNDPQRRALCGGVKGDAVTPALDLPAEDRAAIARLAPSGEAVVAFEGCTLRVITTCRTAGGYTYAAQPATDATRPIGDEAAAYRELPRAAATVAPQLAKSPLQVHSRTVGHFVAKSPSVPAKSLEGDCAGATHIVRGFTVGAFDVGAPPPPPTPSSSSVAAPVPKLHEGKADACAAPAADGPPPECAAVLTLELAPIVDDIVPGGVAGQETPALRAAGQLKEQERWADALPGLWNAMLGTTHDDDGNRQAAQLNVGVCLYHLGRYEESRAIMLHVREKPTHLKYAQAALWLTKLDQKLGR